MPILALTDPNYQPAMRIINAITNANPASVTTTFDHDYIDGLIVRLVIPPGFGMLQANQLIGEITVTGATTFTIDIDTTTFDTFTIPVVYPESYQSSQVVPIAEQNDTFDNVTRNVL